MSGMGNGSPNGGGGARTFEFQFTGGQSAQIDPRDWEARARSVVEDFVADGLSPSDAADALRELRLVDAAGVVWMHDGAAWRSWAAPGTSSGEPVGPLRLQPFSFGLVDAPDEPPDAPTPYMPTDLVPAGGIPAWLAPDPAAAPAAVLEEGLDVMVLDVFDDGWAQIRCSNDWIAWVDADLLIPLDD